MVALLCPNNSHIVSWTDSPCRKQQACYQSHIFAYCETSPPFCQTKHRGKHLKEWRSAHLDFAFFLLYKVRHDSEQDYWPIIGLLFIYYFRWFLCYDIAFRRQKNQSMFFIHTKLQPVVYCRPMQAYGLNLFFFFFQTLGRKTASLSKYW